MANRLKFPVINKCEYLDIIKNKNTLHTFQGDVLEGLKWRQVQEMVGDKLGVGSFRYAIKFSGDDQVKHGTIRSVVTNEKLQQQSQSVNSGLVNAVSELNKKIDGMASNAPQDTTILIQTIKEGHANTVLMYQERLREKENLVTKYEMKIDALEKELDEADAMIAELKSKSGNMEYFKALADIVKVKFGSHAQPLSENVQSDESDIPAELLEVLGVVDWERVEPEAITLILDTLNQFIHKLPLKGQ